MRQGMTIAHAVQTLYTICDSHDLIVEVSLHPS